MDALKRIFTLCLSQMLLFCFFGCELLPTAQETIPPLPDDCGQNSYPLSGISQDLKLLGRTYADAESIICDHTASGIEFNAYIQGDLRLTVEANGDTYFTVYVDGQRLEERYQAIGQTELVINGWKDAETLSYHTFRIVKQTEASWSTARLLSMDFYGKLMRAAKDRDLYIEFIGDSLSCGYGNLWTKNASHADSEAGIALYEDGTLAYPYLTAESLNADVSIMSCSGIGMDLSWVNTDGNGLRMIDFYKMRSYFRDKETAFDFANTRTPDVIVINLGCNDSAIGSPKDAFKDRVKELVQFIRGEYNAKIPIVWVYGMGDSTAGWVETTFRELGGEEEALYMVQLRPDSSGGNGHPSKNAHKTNAVILTNYLKSIGF